MNQMFSCTFLYAFVIWQGFTSINGEKCKLEAPPSTSPLTSLFPCTFYNKGFTNIWASDHQTISDDQNHVNIMLDASSGTGFKTKTTYMYGFFSVAIKLPQNDYTAGVITTFYTSNAELYPNNHDEIDFEFLGRIPSEEYILQTNVYGNGSTNIGREQRLRLWFDPTVDYHDYSILWTSDHIVLYVDDTPIREFPHTTSLFEQFPRKEMFAYATIWDGSDWATHGGKYKTNFTYAPFIAYYSNFIVNGCELPQPTSSLPPKCNPEFKDQSIIPTQLTTQQKESIKWVQENYMTYDYCQDRQRYPTPLPECTILKPRMSVNMHTEL